MGESRTARRESWVGERWTTLWAGRLVLTTVALLGRRVEGRTAGGRELDCWVGERWTTWWERAVLLGRREADDGWPVGWECASLLCERE